MRKGTHFSPIPSRRLTLIPLALTTIEAAICPSVFVGFEDMDTVPCVDDNRSASIRVLVVEDFEPFRRSVCSMLDKNPDLQIVGEVSDGLEAISKAARLQPDLILLDVGLPSLNGIEAARRIRKLSPKSKIVFVSQESASEVVEEAFNLGAWGYVVKTRLRCDLLAAIESVHHRKQFVSSGLSAQDFTHLADGR